MVAEVIEKVIWKLYRHRRADGNFLGKEKKKSLETFSAMKGGRGKKER